MSTQVHYFIRRTNNAFVCEVVLPEKSPVRGQTGKPASQKSLAKQSAAFETCLLLRKNGLLDERFVSTYHRRLPAMRNARLAITSKKTNHYDMMVKPKFWETGRGTVPESLYVTIIRLSPSKKLQREHSPLIFLTREPLPSFPHFPLYLDDNIETGVECISLTAKLAISEDDLDLLTTFTLRVFQELFNKIFDREPHMMPYWLAPAKINDGGPETQHEPRQTLDWDVLQFIKENEELVWSSDKPDDFLDNRFMYDKWNGKYRYYTIAVDPNLKPTDKPPKENSRRRWMENILNYSLSLFKNSRARFLETVDWNQPVIKTEISNLRRNLLDKATEKELQKADGGLCYVCPQPLVISAVSMSHASSLRHSLTSYRFQPMWSPRLSHSRRSSRALSRILFRSKPVKCSS